MNEIIIYNHIMVTMPICTITNDETEIKKAMCSIYDAYPVLRMDYKQMCFSFL